MVARTGDGGWVKCREVWMVTPSFPVNKGAGTYGSLGRVVRFQGQSYKFPPRFIKTEF
jgi:hypothetical protein